MHRFSSVTKIGRDNNNVIPVKETYEHNASHHNTKNECLR